MKHEYKSPVKKIDEDKVYIIENRIILDWPYASRYGISYDDGYESSYEDVNENEIRALTEEELEIYKIDLWYEKLSKLGRRRYEANKAYEDFIFSNEDYEAP
jgi:hypothetical protein